MSTWQRVQTNCRGPHGSVLMVDEDKDRELRRNRAVRHNSICDGESKSSQSGPSWYRSNAELAELGVQGSRNNK